MKKLVFLAQVLILAMTAFVFPAAAEEDDWKVGVLTYLNQAEDENFGANAKAASSLWFLKKGYVSDFMGKLSGGVGSRVKVRYYDSLDALLMALNAQ